MNYANRAVEGVKFGFAAVSHVNKTFDNRVPVEIKKGHFTVKTIETRRELWQVYKLRYDVFHREYKNRRFPFGIDSDRYDQWADHLAIIDNRIGRIVGTYRLIRGIQVEDFYSSSEFDINQISKFDGPKVELSRACIQKSYRNGSVIALLWRGICEYVHTSGACWLFGLGSIRSTVPGEIAEIYKHLTEEGAVDPNLQVPAVNKYLISNFKELVSQAIVSKNARESIPPLLRSYLKLGAVLGSDVALDLEFNCADLFVVLDVNKITASFSKRFQVH